MSIFTPKLMLENVTFIHETLLKEHAIKALILDVDNTLTQHGSQFLPEHIDSWLCEMKKSGIKLMIVSNNTRNRIAPFAKKLDLDFIAMGLKPMTKGFSKAQSILGVSAKEIAVVGDQIYTDIVGGNLKGMFTILVTPFYIEDQFFFRLKRRFEKIHIRRYQKQEHLK